MKKVLPLKQMLVYVFVQAMINWIFGLGDMCDSATFLTHLFAVGPWSIGVIVITSILIEG